jgi:hypothetical protein
MQFSRREVLKTLAALPFFSLADKAQQPTDDAPSRVPAPADFVDLVVFHNSFYGI